MLVKRLISEVEKSEGMIKTNGESLLRCCQEYLRVYEIHENIKDAKNVLKFYLDDKYHLTKENQKNKEIIKDRNYEEKLSISSKLYFYYFWLGYKNFYKEKSEKDFLKMVNNYGCDKNYELDKIFNQVFKKYNKVSDDDMEKIREEIYKTTLYYGEIKSLKRLNLENLFEAIEIFEKEKDRPLPNPNKSVKKIISQECIEDLTNYLEMYSITSKQNYAACFYFMAAAIRSSLTTRKINSHTPNNENKTVYFRQNFEYNLCELKNYLKGLNDLYEEYLKTKNELDEILQTCSMKY